jgi:hypothetical protein
MAQRVIADFVHAAGNAARENGVLPNVPAHEKKRGGNLMLVEKIENFRRMMGMRAVVKRKGYDFFGRFNAPENAARQSRAEAFQSNGVTDIAFEGVPTFGVSRRQEFESEICHAVIWHRSARSAREILPASCIFEKNLVSFTGGDYYDNNLDFTGTNGRPRQDSPSTSHPTQNETTVD